MRRVIIILALGMASASAQKTSIGSATMSGKVSMGAAGTTPLGTPVTSCPFSLSGLRERH